LVVDEELFWVVDVWSVVVRGWDWTHWMGGVWTDYDVLAEVEGKLKISKDVSAANDGLPTLGRQSSGGGDYDQMLG
jgi:hypothetical protein